MLELNKIYQGDCMDLMKGIPDNYFELAIVDPPYGIGEDGRKNHTRSMLAKAKNYSNGSRYDNGIPDKKYFDELFRISKNQIIWGGNYYIEFLKNTPCVIVWDKDNGLNDFADCELAWSSFSTSVRRFRYKWHGMLQEDMKNKEIRIHPNHKPIALYKWLLQNYTNPGDKILDTHLGSASSVIACLEMGFEYVGIEKDEEYFNNAVKRVEQYKSQLKLF